ncbi:hypothetical protein HKCCE3408_10340 [Rhodobacterales bacterium HKCCE3408]|nr:hypothetical protein [Rhodobacterales bacterium HKCCE3408]
MSAADWSCRCGKLRLRVEIKGGKRGICYCRDCQAFARHVSGGVTLNAAGGTDLYPTLPERIEIVAGAEHLALLRLSPKGMFRWYAGCCGTPLANGLPDAGFPFASLHVAGFADTSRLPPVTAHLNVGGATGPVAEKPSAAYVWAFPILTNAIWARLRGRHRRTPFFRNGQPVAEPYVLTLEERRAATP